MIDTARAGVRTAGFAARAARRALRAGRAGATRDFALGLGAQRAPGRPRPRSGASSGASSSVCVSAQTRRTGARAAGARGARTWTSGLTADPGGAGRGVALTAARDDKHHRFTPHPTASQTRHASLDRKRLLYVYRTSSVIVYYGACYVRPGLSNEFDGQGERFPV